MEMWPPFVSQRDKKGPRRKYKEAPDEPGKFLSSLQVCILTFLLTNPRGCGVRARPVGVMWMDFSSMCWFFVL